MNTHNNPGYAPVDYAPVGGVILKDGDIEYNANRKTRKISVRNTGDRPIQVGSHYHFYEVNKYLDFDRKKAFGYHLNIPATTAIRFEPGDEKEVELVSFGGKKRIIGFAGLTMGFACGRTLEPSVPTAKCCGDECDCGDECNCCDECDCGDECNCNKEKQK